jgi:hypothetical protein
MARLVEPGVVEVLDFCARAPVERVFIEDVARRGLGRFVAVRGRGSELGAVCHVGANVVPSGEGCGAFADAARRSRSRMIIGEERAVSELWAAAWRRLPEPREDRPGQPVYVVTEPPPSGDTGLRPATDADLSRLLPGWGGAPPGAPRRASAGARASSSRRAARGCGSRTT